MTPDYSRPVFPGSFFKAPRGTAVLKKEKAEQKETEAEIEIKRLVKARDGKCRWPERHRCRGGLECAHLKDASLGGQMVTSNLILLCKWVHRTGPQSIHSKDLEVVPLTKKGADGACKFFRRYYAADRKDEFRRKLIAQESAPGVIAK